VAVGECGSHMFQRTSVPPGNGRRAGIQRLFGTGQERESKIPTSPASAPGSQAPAFKRDSASARGKWALRVQRVRTVVCAATRKRSRERNQKGTLGPLNYGNGFRKFLEAEERTSEWQCRSSAGQLAS